MKKLNIIQKIVLSIFPVFGFLFFLFSFFLASIPYELYLKIWVLLVIIMIFQLLFLIRRILLLRVEVDRKIIAMALILIAPLQLYYIWKIDDTFVR
jgi:hypothetical protein